MIHLSLRLTPIFVLVLATLTAVSCTALKAPEDASRDVPRGFKDSTYEQIKEHWLKSGAVASLDVSRYLPLDAETLLVCGRLKRNAVEYSAIILRGRLVGRTSEGLRWSAVLEGEQGHTVEYLDFIDGRHGWALSLWTVEGAKEAFVYGTRDGGQTWSKTSEVPVPDCTASPSLFLFRNARQGRVVFNGAGGPSPGQTTFETEDGGRTWNQVSEKRAGRPWSGRREGPTADVAAWHMTHDGGDYAFSISLPDGKSLPVGRLPAELPN